jgi:hypothetical protein
MKWDEVRKLYPDQWIKLNIISSHVDNDYLYIDELEVIKTLVDDHKATIELTKSRGNNLVFHTSHDIIRTKLIKNLGLFRRIPN